VDLLNLLFHIIIILYCFALDSYCSCMSCLVSTECLIYSLLVLSYVFLFIVIFWQLSGRLSQDFNSQDDSVLNVT